MKMHAIILTLAAPLLLGCSSDDDTMGTVPTAVIAPAVSMTQQLSLDITVPWPGIAEALRRLFATQAPAADAPMHTSWRFVSPRATLDLILLRSLGTVT